MDLGREGTMARVRKPDGEGTLPGTHSNDEDAPDSGTRAAFMKA
jgi:hypothetical protein